jgi:HAE1 family hydrophobic/amphiphilic exporter-1
MFREKPLVDFRPVQNWYARVLGKILRRRYWVIALATIVMIGSLPIAFGLGVDMFADEEIPQLFVFVTMPEGTRLEVTDQVVRQLEESAFQIPQNELKNVVANAGIQQTPGEWFFKPSVGQLFVELVNRKEREREVDEIMNEMREKASKIPGIQALTFEKIQSGPPTGAPIEVKVRGEHLDELLQVSAEVQTALRNIDGVQDIRDDFITGTRELRITVDEEKASLLGLSVMQVAGYIYNAFHGAVATTFRDGDEEIDVRVRYREDARQQLVDLANLKVTTPFQSFVLLKDVAKLEETSGFASIKHDDRERAITITANVDNKKITSIAANRKLQEAWAEIASRHPGYSLKFGGEFSEFQDAFKNLGLLFALGVAIMFTIMAAQFNSLMQPLIIFAAVIFAFWGAVMGLFVIGSPFTINNLFGLVALAGVSVNNSIVLIEFINIARANGVSRWRSILHAGKLRVRPILLTSATTVLGLAPMAIGLGGYSDVWGPLATVMVWGLTASSILSLFLIPCLYSIIGDIKRLFMGKRFMDEHGRLAHWEEKRQLEEELARIDHISVRRLESERKLEGIDSVDRDGRLGRREAQRAEKISR